MHKKKSIQSIFIIILLIILILTSVGNIQASKNIFYVDSLGAGDYNTIQDAIDSAKPGDRIYVKNGVYQENLMIDKEIYLEGEDCNNTIIDGNYKDDVVNILSDNVTILSFSIRNSGNVSYQEIVDAGVESNSKNIVLKNLIITQNGAYGIYMYNADYSKIENCSIKNNGYRGVYIESGKECKIAFNDIKNHSYGVYLYDVEYSDVLSNYISDSIQAGLYLRARSDNNNITGNIFIQNMKGTHVQGSTENTFFDNLYWNNRQGIYFCCHGEYNLVYSNFFMDNDEHVYGYLINSFDNGTIGNFWDDYSGFDIDGDGIGDIPYIVTDDYGIENIDSYPVFNDNIDSDIDNDGLNNYIEYRIGSDSFIKNNFTTFLINNIKYYFVDVDNDNVYDVLYNSISEDIGITEKQNMSYLIDYNSDGEWDYIWGYNGGLDPYEEKDVQTPGFEFIIFLLVFLVLFITFRIKKHIF